MGIPKINKRDLKTKSKTRRVLTPNPEEFTDYTELFDPDNDKDKEIVKKRIKFIKDVKGYIRKSDEYKRLMKFLKVRKGLDRCGIHQNVTYPDFSIEIHHYPFVAEDIVYTIVYKKYECNETINFSTVADEFMRIHYLEIVGLYPLCEVCHEYNHSESGESFIPSESLYGDPDKFFEIYKDYMSDKLVAKFNYWKELNKGYDVLTENLPEEILKHYLYITDEQGVHFISVEKLHNFLLELQK